MAFNTTVDLANIIPTIWSEKWYQELRNNLPMGNFFSRDFEGELVRGNTVNVSTLVAPTGEVISAGATETDFTPETLSLTKTPIVVNKIASAAVEISDLGELQSISLETELKNGLVYAVAKQVESAIITALVPSGSSPDHDIAPATAGKLVAADVNEMATLLDIQKVPNMDRGLFLSPSYHGDLRNSSVLISSDFIPAGSPAATGVLYPTIYGFQTALANLLGNDIGYAAHKSALAIVMQKGLTVKVSDRHPALKYGYVISASLVFGLKLMDNKRFVKISA